MISLTVNGTSQHVDVSPDTPLLWVLRDHLGLTGTKYGCGMALCGACTVHVNGQATRSCVMPISAAAGKSVLTIEGLSRDGSAAIANRGRLWLPPSCCARILDQATLISMMRCPAISAGAERINGFDAPFTAPRPRPPREV